MNTPNTMTKIGAATHILAGIGAPINQHTVGAMVGWMNAEGGHWSNNASYNPLNTTLGAPGARAINSAGVKAYGNWGQGISATVQTLKQPNMAGIVQAFHSSNPQAVIHAIGSSPWGTSGSLVAQTIGAATGQSYAIPSSRNIAAAMSQTPRQNGLGTANTPGVTNTAPTTSTDWGSALANALMSESASAPSENGTVRVQNPLGAAINAVSSGQYTTSTPAQTKLTPSAALTGAVTRATASGQNDINPLQHFTLGRNDMGVDANAKPGTPILAPNDAKVVGTMANWYQGQPYVALQLLSGPNKGKVMYVAEQITGIPKQGQIIRRGQAIATYAPSGTGIEIGWANPKSPLQTLAQSTGQTGDSSHGNAPAGLQFRNYLGALGAH